jgi:hypothetical protein
MDEEYNLHWKILATEPLLEKHDGANIGNKLNEIINLYEIDKEKIHIFLRDAASSMKRAMENIQLSHFDCMVHKIQLVYLFIKFKQKIFFIIIFRRFPMHLNIETLQLPMPSSK